MRLKIYRRQQFFVFSILFLFVSCKNNNKTGGDTRATTVEELQEKTKELIKNTIEYAAHHQGKTEDSSFLIHQPGKIKLVYEKNDFVPVWSSKKLWLPAGDSLYDIISNAQLYGLFPEDYHHNSLKEIRNKFQLDTTGKKDRVDAALWAKADLMLTDAFTRIIKDVKLGRLPNDSISLRKDTILTDDFYLLQYESVQNGKSLTQLLQTLEPDHFGYRLLKKGIRKFLDSADYRSFTFVPSPSKNAVLFKQALQKRLYEEGFLETDSIAADSLTIAIAVKQFQQKKGIAVDGRVGEGTLRMMNLNDREKFISIAISLDKYKLLPEKMPPKYIWVNIPSFQMQLMEGDLIQVYSKVIIGKPHTSTPELNSAINSLITYPQWVPPPSIVMKEILPAVKKNPAYLGKKGFSLLNSKGEEVDPFTVDWSIYTKGIPYRVVQGSGDANSLGIMKFVFNNKYSVYLHDTNQRYLFALNMRSLSHGCVRVQEWEKLALYLVNNDSKNAGLNNTARADSLQTWLQKKQKKIISLKNNMPIFIRYITCEGKDGGIVFYDDIYGYDKKLKEKFFAGR